MWILQEVKEEEKKKKEKGYAFQRQSNEKPSIMPGCPGLGEVHEMGLCTWRALLSVPHSRPWYMAVLLCSKQRMRVRRHETCFLGQICPMKTWQRACV